MLSLNQRFVHGLPPPPPTILADAVTPVISRLSQLSYTYSTEGCPPRWMRWPNKSLHDRSDTQHLCQRFEAGNGRAFLLLKFPDGHNIAGFEQRISPNLKIS